MTTDVINGVPRDEFQREAWVESSRLFLKINLARVLKTS